MPCLPSPRSGGRAARGIGLLIAVIVTFAGPAAAQQADYGAGRVYATVKGWTVTQNDAGCSAFQNNMPVVLNTPPAGGWQLIFPYPDELGEGDFGGFIDIDKFSFSETYYGDGRWFYSSFPLAMRQTLAQGNRLYAEIGGGVFDTTLTGSTAALLKVEECWQRLTGWTAASNKAGTFAFAGD